MRLGYALGLGIQDLQPAIVEQSAGLIAAEYDGINDYFDLAADLSGLSDSDKLSASFWIKTTDLGTVYPFIGDNDGYVQTTIDSSEHISPLYRNSAVAIIWRATSSPTSISTGNWTCVLLSVDLSTAGRENLYFGDTDVITPVTFSVGATIDFTRGYTSLGVAKTGAGKFDGALSEIWYEPGTYIDFSVESNRRKFIDASGLPVELGDNGEIPTGTSPIFYSPLGDGTNKGTGGDLTETGAVVYVDGPGA